MGKRGKNNKQCVLILPWPCYRVPLKVQWGSSYLSYDWRDEDLMASPDSDTRETVKPLDPAVKEPAKKIRQFIGSDVIRAGARRVVEWFCSAIEHTKLLADKYGTALSTEDRHTLITSDAHRYLLYDMEAVQN